MADDVVMAVDDVERMALAALEHAGLPAAQAEPVARAIAAGERDECPAHGLYRLEGCVKTARSPLFSVAARLALDEVTPAFLRADAGYGYSLPAFELALAPLDAAARSCGIAALAVNHCFHFSALWFEVEQLTARGLATLIVTPSHRWVAPEGGTRPVLGTNPIAFGWPRAGRDAYVFDFATSVAARGNIALCELAGQPVPMGWGVDAQGRPSADAAAVLAGAMCVFGGHKGSALSTLVELLAGPLIGDWTSMESTAFDAGHGALPCHGELVLAFDPAVLGGADAAASAARAEALFAAFTDQGARLPSERRYAARARSLAHGVRVPRALYDRVLALLP